MYKWTFYPVRQYSSGFSWEAEPIQFIGIDIGERVIIGIGSHGYGSQEVPNLLSASWRTREASLVIQSEFLRLEGLMVEISVWVWKPKNQKHSVCLRAGEEESLKSRRESKFQFHLRLPLCSLQALKGLDGAHRPGWGQLSLLNLQIPVPMSSWDTGSDIPKNTLVPFIWASFSPLKFQQKISHHKSITSPLGTYTHLFKPYLISK